MSGRRLTGLSDVALFGGTRIVSARKVPPGTGDVALFGGTRIVSARKVPPGAGDVAFFGGTRIVSARKVPPGVNPFSQELTLIFQRCAQGVLQLAHLRSGSDDQARKDTPYLERLPSARVTACRACCIRVIPLTSDQWFQISP